MRAFSCAHLVGSFYPFASSRSSSGCIHVGSLFANEEQGEKIKERLARDAFGAFASHYGPVHDVTDTDCWPQNSDRVYATFTRRCLTNSK